MTRLVFTGAHAHPHGAGYAHAHAMSDLQQEVIWWTILAYLTLFAVAIGALHWQAKKTARKKPAKRRRGRKRR